MDHSYHLLSCSCLGMLGECLADWALPQPGLEEYAPVMNPKVGVRYLVAQYCEDQNLFRHIHEKTFYVLGEFYHMKSRYLQTLGDSRVR